MPALIASKALLDDARKAYHALMTGTSARVVVDQNGERVEFTAANGPKLYNYIRELEVALQTPCGQAPGFNPALGPAGFTF